VRDDGGIRDGDGPFEVEPAEKKQTQARAAAVDKRFRTFDPHQVLLLPPSLDDWLPQDHLTRFVADLLDEVLDLGPGPRQNGPGEGRSRPWRPWAGTVTAASTRAKTAYVARQDRWSASAAVTGRRWR
jgi:hypothetical protein